MVRAELRGTLIYTSMNVVCAGALGWMPWTYRRYPTFFHHPPLIIPTKVGPLFLTFPLDCLPTSRRKMLSYQPFSLQGNPSWSSFQAAYCIISTSTDEVVPHKLGTCEERNWCEELDIQQVVCVTQQILSLGSTKFISIAAIYNQGLDSSSYTIIIFS